MLDYLGGLGFDHLYLSRPSSRRGAGRPAAATARSSRQETESAVATDAPSAAVQAPADPAAAPGATPHEVAAASPEERFRLLDQVRSRAEGCVACGLARGRRKVVFGSGHPGAGLMLIGEGPGAEEDRKGLPFVGAAGALLTRIIEAIDLRREEVYIANMVKCRPPRNRDPTADEVAACRPFLEQQIDLVAPALIVVRGRVAAQALLETSAPLSRLRGRWHQVRGVPARVTYHPAALLRYEQYKRPTWEDMKAVRDRLRELRG